MLNLVECKDKEDLEYTSGVFHYTASNGMSHRCCWQLASKLSATPVWHIPLLCVQWKTPDDGQRNCPKHV